MKVIVRTQTGEKVQLEIKDEYLYPRLVLKKRAQNFAGLPEELTFQILSYLDPLSLSRFSLVDSYLKRLCESDEIWNSFAKKRNWKTLKVPNGREWKRYFLQRHYWANMAQSIWSRLQRFVSNAIEISLNPPVREDTLHEAEIRLGYEIPEELKASLRIHDGQSSLLPYSDMDIGLLTGHRLLSVSEMTVMREKFGLKNLPLTAALGHKQWFMDWTGQIFLISGWDVVKKADNWLHLLQQLLD